MHLIRQETMELAGIGLYRFKVDGTVLFMDRIAQEVFELEDAFPDPSAVVGKNISDLLTYTGPKGLLRREIRKHGHVRDFMYPFKTLKGTEKTMVLDAFLMQDKETGEEAIQVVVREAGEQLQVEESLRLATEQHEQLVETVPHGIQEIDTEGNIIFANSAYHRMNGYADGELIGSNVRDRVVEEERDQLISDIKTFASAQPEPTPYRNRNITKDGRVIDVEFVWNYKRNSGGEVVGFVSVITDVTEHKQAEEALRESRRELDIRNQIDQIFLTIPDDEMYREVLEVILQAVESKHGTFGYIDKNGAFVVPSITRDVWDQCQVPDKAIIFPREGWGDSVWGRAIRQKKTLYSNKPFCVPKGHIPVSRDIAVPVIHREEVVGLLHVANKDTDYDEKDIQLLEAFAAHIGPILDARLERDRQEKERKRAEEALRQYERAVEASKDAIVAVDQNYVYLVANKAFLDYYHLTRDEVVGHTAAEVLGEEFFEKVLQPNLDHCLKGDPVHFETSRQYPEIGERFFQVSYYPLKGKHEEVIGAVAIISDITERKRREERLGLLSSAAEQSRDGLAVADTKGYVLFSNEAFASMHGLSPEELVGKHLSIFHTPEQMPAVDAANKQVLEAGDFSGEIWHTRRDGSVFPSLMHSTCLRNEAGDPVGIVGTLRDITDLKQVEKALRENEARYRTLFEDSPISLFEVDLSDIKVFIDGLRDTGVNDFRTYFDSHPQDIAHCISMSNIIEVNKAILELFAAENKEELLRRVDEVFSAEAHDAFKEALVAFAEGKMIFENEQIAQTFKGDRIHIVMRLSIAPGFEDTWSKVFVSIVDVTERLQIAEALARERQFIDALMEAVPDAIYFKNTESRFIRVNKAEAEWDGLDDPAEVVGKTDFDFFTEEHAQAAFADEEEIMRSGRPLIGKEEKETWADGRETWVSTTKAPLRDEEGNIIGTFGISRDITERKRTEEQVRTLTRELLRAQETERRRIAFDLHDHVGQDLSALKIGCETLFDKQKRIPREIRQKVSNLSKILEGCIRAVRDLAYELHPADLGRRGLVRTVFHYCKDFSASNGLEVDFYSAGMEDLELDSDTQINLFRLIQEGLNNIMKHADAGHAAVRLTASFPNIILRIEDDGKGFDVEERLAAAFKEKRMGLWSMQERVSLLDGKMRIESRPAKGTTILIEIPHKEETSGSKEKHIDRR